MSTTATNESAPQATPSPAPSPATMPASRPATLHELKSACPGASAEFLVSQMDANATIERAGRAYMAHLAEQNAKLQQQLTTAVPPSAAPASAPPTAPRPGVSTLGSARPASRSGDGTPNDHEIDAEEDPIGAWNALVNAETSRNGGNRPAATKIVAAQHPELRARYIEAYNAECRAAEARIRDDRRRQRSLGTRR